MKYRIVAMLLALILALSLCACSDSPDIQLQPDQTNQPDTVQPSDPQLPGTNDQTDNSTDINDMQDPAPDGNSDAENTSDPVQLSEVRSAMINQMSITDPLLLECDMLVDLYGISVDMLTQAAAFVTMAGTFPDEIILTEAVDEDAAAAIETALQKRLDEVLVQSETYDAENFAAAQECKVVRNGLFVALILSPKQADLTAIYEGFFA